jgi:hypothetical protein
MRSNDDTVQPQFFLSPQSNRGIVNTQSDRCRVPRYRLRRSFRATSDGLPLSDVLLCPGVQRRVDSARVTDHCSSQLRQHHVQEILRPVSTHAP